METGPVKPPWRFIVGATLLIGLALYSSWQSLKYYDIGIFTHRYAKYGAVASDSISRFENRLACVRAELSPGERVGFIAPLKGNDWTEIYLWTQYALAPTIVTGDESQRKIIAVYPDEQSFQESTAGRYLILVDCRNGVGLLASARTQ